MRGAILNFICCAILLYGRFIECGKWVYIESMTVVVAMNCTNSFCHSAARNEEVFRYLFWSPVCNRDKDCCVLSFSDGFVCVSIERVFY